MRSRRPLPAHFSNEAFRVADALDAGVSRRQLARRDLRAPFRGVRFVGNGDDFLARCRALALVLPEGAGFCGPTAARLQGLPIPQALENDPRLFVSVPAPMRAIRQPVVCAVQRPAHVRLDPSAKLPQVTPEETLVSLARRLEGHDLTAVADRLVSGTLHTKPILSLPALSGCIADAAGRPGIQKLRLAMTEVREGAWSRPETLLRILVLRAGFPEPVLNQPVRLLDGSVAFPDLSWPALRYAMEYDGGWHAATPGQWAKDAERRERFADSSWLSTQVTGGQLFGSHSALVARFVHRFAERGVQPSRSIDMSRLPRFVP